MGAQAGGGPLAGGSPGSLGLGKGRRAAGLLGKFTASCPSPFAPACPARRRLGHRRRDPTPRLPREQGGRQAEGGGSADPAVAPAPGGQAAPLLALRSVLTEISPLSYPHHLPGFSGMRRSPDVSPRRLSDISPQLRQLKYLVVDEAIKEDLKWSRSVEDLTGGPAGLTSIEERILRITGYYGYQPWAASYKSKSPGFICPGASVRLPWRSPHSLGSARSHASSRPPASLPADTDPALQLLGRGPERESSRTLGISDPFSYTSFPPSTRLYPYPLAMELSQYVSDGKQCILH